MHEVALRRLEHTDGFEVCVEWRQGDAYPENGIISSSSRPQTPTTCMNTTGASTSSDVAVATTSHGVAGAHTENRTSITSPSCTT